VGKVQGDSVWEEVEDGASFALQGEFHLENYSSITELKSIQYQIKEKSYYKFNPREIITSLKAEFTTPRSSIIGQCP
jgi:hypothetical protein